MQEGGTGKERSIYTDFDHSTRARCKEGTTLSPRWNARVCVCVCVSVYAVYDDGRGRKTRTLFPVIPPRAY